MHQSTCTISSNTPVGGRSGQTHEREKIEDTGVMTERGTKQAGECSSPRVQHRKALRGRRKTFVGVRGLRKFRSLEGIMDVGGGGLQKSYFVLDKAGSVPYQYLEYRCEYYKTWVSLFS